MKKAGCCVLLGVVLLFGGVLSTDEDCVEGEEGCGVVETPQVPVAETSNGIYLLTDQNFAEVVKQEELIMATFYAPWCHHCHNALTVFEEAAKLLQPHGISIGKLDIEANKETKNKYQIKQVPEVRIFKKGVMYPYEGPGDIEGVQAIVDFMIEERLKDEDGAVLKFTEDNFDNILKVSPLVLVEFFADWCQPCQALEPHFFAAARRLHKNNPPILLGQVRVPDQIELAKRFPMGGYPQLIMFRYGNQYNYTGPREEEGIVKYMLRQSGPSSIPLDSEAEVNEFGSSESETRAVAFLDNSRALDSYFEAGNEVRLFMELGHCTSREVARSMGIEMGSVVIFHAGNLISKYEEGQSVIPSLPDESREIANLLLEHARPLVGEMTQENQLTLFGGRPLLVAYFDVDWDKQLRKATRYWHGLIASVAKDYNNQDLSFAIANENDFPTDIKVLGMDDWGEDITVGIFSPHNVRYPMKEELYADSLREFIEDFLGGNLEPYLRSEPTPKKSKNALVETVVGKTFQKFMGNPKSASLVKLCMADANGCKEAEEHFHQVVIRYEGSTEVTFGEMNMALNDLPIGTELDPDLPAYLFSAKGSNEIVQVSPKPTDENDIIFFLKYRNSIRPTVSDRELDRRAEKKKKEQKKRKEQKKNEQKKKAKEEL